MPAPPEAPGLLNRGGTRGPSSPRSRTLPLERAAKSSRIGLESQSFWEGIGVVLRGRLLKSEPAPAGERDVQRINSLSRRQSERRSLSGVLSIRGHGQLAREKSIGRAEAMRGAMLAVMTDTLRPSNWVPPCNRPPGRRSWWWARVAWGARRGQVWAPRHGPSAAGGSRCRVCRHSSCRQTASRS